MARSYFSGIAGKAQTAPPLLPPRPVENLWKSAKLDQPVPQAETFPAPKDEPSHPVSRRNGRGVVRPQDALETDEPLDVSHETVARFRTLRTSPSPNASEPADNATIADAPASPEAGARRLPHQAVGQPTSSAPVLTSSRIHFVHATEPPVVQPPPVMPREDAAPDSRLRPRPDHQPEVPASEQPPAKQVHIGRIEVQVVAPPVQSRRAAQPASRTRLARGYSYWHS